MNVSGEMIALIRQTMREGNTAEAVNLFLQTGDKASLLLFEKFSEAQKQSAAGLIGLEAWGQAQAQICLGILHTELMLETEATKNPSTEIKVKILRLLQEHKTEQAFALCEDFGDRYLMLLAQLNAAKNQAGAGLLESEYYEATKSRVSFALQELMGQVKEPIPSVSWIDKIRSMFKSLVLW